MVCKDYDAVCTPLGRVHLLGKIFCRFFPPLVVMPGREFFRCRYFGLKRFWPLPVNDEPRGMESANKVSQDSPNVVAQTDYNEDNQHVHLI